MMNATQKYIWQLWCFLSYLWELMALLCFGKCLCFATSPEIISFPKLEFPSMCLARRIYTVLMNLGKVYLGYSKNDD